MWHGPTPNPARAAFRCARAAAEARRSLRRIRSLLPALALAALASCITSDSSTTVPSGLPHGAPALYDDTGPAAPGQELRALIALRTRDPDGLAATIDALYDPSSPDFRHYLTVDEWMARHAPTASDVAQVQTWLESFGLAVPRVARNRLLLEVTGRVEDFEKAFDTEVHVLVKNDGSGDTIFGLADDLSAPASIAERVASVVTADLPAASTPLPAESGEVEIMPPAADGSLTLAQVAKGYGIDKVGARGTGVTIGVVAGATFKQMDVESFWLAQQIQREAPLIVETAEKPATRYSETTLDVEWSGGLAPDAQLIVYEGPDAHDTSLVYAFNEAIGDGRAQVITDSFAHRESSQPRAIREQYDASARMAAALGITVVAASGDSGLPDVPSSSPYVTAVGGTELALDESGTVMEERAWSMSGCGDALSFDAPVWQAALAANGKRAIVDVALAAGTPYSAYIFGQWRQYQGTSFASPVFAGLMAVVDSARHADGKPPAGLLNPLLYRDESVQHSFRDVVSGASGADGERAAGPGWDCPTGWGAPDAAGLAEVLP